jgi:hypothetical protein
LFEITVNGVPQAVAASGPPPQNIKYDLVVLLSEIEYTKVKRVSFKIQVPRLMIETLLARIPVSLRNHYGPGKDDDHAMLSGDLDIGKEITLVQGMEFTVVGAA